jgi:hypothetical protein
MSKTEKDALSIPATKTPAQAISSQKSDRRLIGSETAGSFIRVYKNISVNGHEAAY